MISILNQKGGVGKTTTLSLGVALSKLGKEVILMEVDLKGDLTVCIMRYYNQDNILTIANLIVNFINDSPLNKKIIFYITKKILI